MQKVKYLILGAGPAGLTFANMLKRNNEDSFIVLEREAEAGGLCRSTMVDGAPFDIGGGHFLDVRREKVNEFLFSFMPEEEWDRYDRDSQISLKNSMVHHPLEANIWEMDSEEQVAYLESISRAGSNLGKEMPEKFVEWIYWKLGDKIANDYMLPYNKKMFADELDELGTYWLEKLPNVSFRETLLSCIEHKPYGTQPGHAQFYYPKKYGYGELWLRMAEAIKDKMLYNSKVVMLDAEKKIVRTSSGDEFCAEKIITTIPWNSIDELVGFEDSVKELIAGLKSSAVETRYFAENLDTTAQWIYYPDEEISYHRILVRHNFCPNSKGYWTETRKERMLPVTDEHFSYLNDYAYPLNTIGKNEDMNVILTSAKAKSVYGLGRWGEHQHYNSDVTVERAMQLAEQLLADN